MCWLYGRPPTLRAMGWQHGAKWGQVVVWGASDLGSEGASLG